MQVLLSYATVASPNDCMHAHVRMEKLEETPRTCWCKFEVTSRLKAVNQRPMNNQQSTESTVNSQQSTVNQGPMIVRVFKAQNIRSDRLFMP